ncbi:MAG TPA: acyltransferase [Thermoanaerobaculia bacterium]
MEPSPQGVPRRIPELDGLRGLAILLVLLWHYAAVPLATSTALPGIYLARLLRLSWSGVDLFFVLSGFLIGGILLDHRDAPRYFPVFYLRRACRILPLYAAWLLLFFSLPRLVPSMIHAPGISELFARPLPGWSYLTFTQNFVMAERGDFGAVWLSPTWSLAIEEHFYLVLPMAIRFLPARSIPPIFIGAGLAGLLGRLAAGPERYIAVYVLTPLHFDSLLGGVLCAFALREPTYRHWLLRARRPLYGLVLVFFGILLSLSLFRHYGFEGSPYLFSILAVFYGAVLILAVTEGRGPIAWLTRRRWLRELGIVAYAVYLSHLAILFLAHGLILGRSPSLATGPEVMTTLAAAIACVTLAFFSWRALERPLISWGRRLDYGDGDAAHGRLS